MVIPASIQLWIHQHPARFGTLSGWFQQGCGLLATFLTMPYLLDPQRLSAQESGLWFAVLGMLAMVNLTDFGLGLVLSRQAAYTFGQTTASPPPPADFLPTSPGWAGLAELYHVGKRLFFWVNLAGVALIILGYHVLLPLGKLGQHMSASTLVTWYLVGASTLCSLQSKLYQSFLDGLGRIYVGRLITGVGQLLFGSLSLIVLWTFPSLPWLAAMALVSSLFQWFWLRRHLLGVAQGRLQVGPSSQPVSLRRLWRIAAPLGIVLSSAFLASAVQVPLLGFVMGAAAVAPFYLAQKIAQVGIQALLQFNAPQVPLFTRQIAAGDWQGAAARFRRSAGWVMGVALGMFAVYYGFSTVVVGYWVGPNRYVTPPVLAILTVDAVCITGSALCAHYVVAAGRNPLVWTTLAAGLLNVAGCLLLPGWLGLTGLALAGLLAGGLTNYWWVPVHMWRLLQWLRNQSTRAPSPPGKPRQD